MAAADDEEQRLQADTEERDASSLDSSDSEDDVSDGGQSPSKMEWLATGRERRSTAGNRMKSMIAAEEPDDELELLFAEDGDDAGFTDVEDDGSDAQMSSSDDEDAQDNGDELEGEKELEKQVHESRQAARKRKAQEAIPQKFRKKVKIDTSQTTSASATPTAPKPRPKKKSERISWLPSPADMPTRASRRETTIAGKEQLHKQMAEREIKRLKQLEAMERKAKKMEALKKPPMTQAERLAEAALVEKRNAKSLNRWEEAEKQREEERKAKLAALNTRTLKGPVVTFWSGVGEWVDGKLKHVGKVITIEEKPAKKKRPSAVGNEGPTESSKDKAAPTDDDPSPEKLGVDEPHPSPSLETDTKSHVDKKTSTLDVNSSLTGTSPKPSSPKHPTPIEPSQEARAVHSGAVEKSPLAPPVPQAIPTIHTGSDQSTINQSPKPLRNGSQSQILPPSDIRPPDLKQPAIQPPNANFYTTSMFAPPAPSPLMKAPDQKPHSNSFLAPPAGLPQSGLSLPMHGYNTSPNPISTSNVLAPPNPAQRQSPLSIPQNNVQLYPAPSSPLPTTTKPPRPTQTPAPQPVTSTSSVPPVIPTPSRSRQPPKPLGTSKPTKVNAQKNQPKQVTPPPPPSPPANGKATRNCIILQNFNENAIKEKSVQNRILFNQEMQKLPKPGPIVRCVITNHPARYRDPKTGLPYYNAYAYKEIQKLYSGKYRWSSLVGLWSGSGTSAAADVPARFLDPDAPGPPKEPPQPQPAAESDETNKQSETQDVKLETTGKPSANDPGTSTPQPSRSAATDKVSKPSSDTPTVVDRPGPEPDREHNPTVTGELSSSTKSCIPTTEATFALNTEYTAPISSPAVGNTVPQTKGTTSAHRPADTVNQPTNPIPPSAVTGSS